MFKIDAATGERLGLLATAIVSDGGPSKAAVPVQRRRSSMLGRNAVSNPITGRKEHT